MEEHNEAFRVEVLENNKIFDDYDKSIINDHVTNFYCVFQLGYCASLKSLREKLQDLVDMQDKVVCANELAQAKLSGEVNAFLTCIRKIDELRRP